MLLFIIMAQKPAYVVFLFLAREGTIILLMVTLLFFTIVANAFPVRLKAVLHWPDMFHAEVQYQRIILPVVISVTSVKRPLLTGRIG